MLAFWDSVTDLRRIEFIFLLIAMITPLVCGTFLLTIRHRIKTLQTQTIQSQGFSYQEKVKKLETQKRHLEAGLESTGHELSSLRRVTAPRQITENQENILVEKLRGVQA